MHPSRVLSVPPAPPAEAAIRFRSRLAFETDAADVTADLAAGGDGFVLVDARSAEAYAAAHVPGAVNLPAATLDAVAAATLPAGRVAVTYCWGPGCNGATKGAAALAALGVPVKEMIGGIEYWVREGGALEGDDVPGVTTALVGAGTSAVACGC